MYRIDVEHRFPQPVRRVFEHFVDNEGWSDWAGVGKVRLLRPGSPERNGVGAVRALPPGFVHEEVFRFEPPADDASPGRMDYRIIRGPKVVWGHRGEVTFTPSASGTTLRWVVTFEALPILGWVTERALAAIFAKILRRLAAHLER